MIISKALGIGYKRLLFALIIKVVIMTTAVIIAIVEPLGTYQIPGIILSNIYVLTHLIFTSTLMN